MELLIGACEVGLLQGPALHAALATALRLPLPCPAASTCLGKGQLVLGMDPAHCMSQALGDFVALKRLAHQDWVKVAGRATRCQGQMDRQCNLTGLLSVGNAAKTSNQSSVPVTQQARSCCCWAARYWGHQSGLSCVPGVILPASLTT